jgi:hypothetical protein
VVPGTLWVQPPDTVALWQEVQAFVHRQAGVRSLDHTTLDQPYARKMEVVTRHWSGTYHHVVAGINLLTLVWTDGTAILPCDCRVYDNPLPDGQTKNEHFRAMLMTAHTRGFAPRMVCFDRWSQQSGQLESCTGTWVVLPDAAQA